jgi:hypothetical protein
MSRVDRLRRELATAEREELARPGVMRLAYGQRKRPGMPAEMVYLGHAPSCHCGGDYCALSLAGITRLA